MPALHRATLATGGGQLGTLARRSCRGVTGSPAGEAAAGPGPDLGGPVRRSSTARCASMCNVTGGMAGSPRALSPSFWVTRSIRRPRSAARGRRSGSAPPAPPGCLVERRRQVAGEVVGAQDRPACPELDDGDRGELHRPHPEPLERQVEQGQQRDLEHAVVADRRSTTGRPAARPCSRLPESGRGCLARRRGQRPTAAGGVPAGPGPRPRRATRRPAPTPRSGGGASRPASRRSASRSRRGGGPPRRPGRSRGSRGRPRRRRPGAAGHGRGDRLGGLGRPAAGRVDQLARRPDGQRQGGRCVRACEPAATSAAWRRPGSRQRRFGLALEPALDDELATRRGGRGRASRRAVRDERLAVARRSPLAAQADRPQVAARPPAPGSAPRPRADVVVEGEDHQRVLARPRPGEVHRADVHVGLAEHAPDPPDHARLVRVAGDRA